MKPYRKIKALVSSLLLFSSILAWGVSPCDLSLLTFKERYAQTYPTTWSVLNKLEVFAEKNKLPRKLLNLGPDEREVPRMFVGLDITKPELVEEYLKTFSLEGKLDENAAGTLALEFQFEHEGNYVTGVLRPKSGLEDKIYRWGREDLTRKDWWSQWLMAHTQGDPIHGYAHLVGLAPSEVENVKTFLANPALRGACKSDNCVAWTSSIELGKTAQGASDEERNYLFSALGMSRSMAHFEIGRRLIHAANERHGAIIVFYEGEAGLKAFAELEKHLPPDPKIPYESVVKGLGYAKDSPVMKAVEKLEPGSRIFLPIAAGASPEGVAALVQKSGQIWHQAEQAGQKYKPFDLHMFVNGVSETTLKKATNKNTKMNIKALFLGGNLRELNKQGKVDVVPGYLSDYSRYFKDPSKKDFQYDAVLVRVSPPDENGNCSLGPNHDLVMSLLKAQPDVKIIAEINSNIPRTFGDNFIHKDRFFSSFTSATELAGPPVVPFSEVEKKIGENLAELIDSGSTLQIGIGNIFGGLPDAMVAKNKKEILISTEMFGDPLKQMIENGTATSAETGFAYGSPQLYKWLDKNQKVKFVETEYVNSPARVQETKKFHAVNTALQVNLKGDVNATHGMDGLRMSSPGGQVEFMSGAARSEGGKAIIAIRSTAKNGEISSISLDLYGSAVTTPSESVTHVVTEYGVAELAGKTEEQRVIALINVAHPKFRKSLIDGAIERKLLRKENSYAIKTE